MALFKLIKGSHVSGSGTDVRQYSANDPKNCIVESKDVDLAADMPEKFIDYEGPRAKNSGRRMRPEETEIAPPGPPDDSARDLTSSAVPMTAEQRRQRAERLRKLADEFEAAADAQDSGESEGFEEAEKHVRENFAKSDEAEEFEERGRALLEARRKNAAATAPRPKATGSRGTPPPAPPEEEMGATDDEETEAPSGEEASTAEGDESSPQDEEEGSGEESAPPPPSDGLDKMSVPALRGVAQKEKVDIRSQRTREGIVQAIRTKRGR